MGKLPFQVLTPLASTASKLVTVSAREIARCQQQAAKANGQSVKNGSPSAAQNRRLT